MKITPDEIRAFKARGEQVACLTAYDYPMGKLLDEAGVPLLLVGDSLGMVVLGHPDTTHVTMADMLHHTSAVARAKPNALVVGDLPYKSYETVDDAVCNGRRLMDAGAEAVKLEGGRDKLDQIRALIADGIPVMGHLGMLPQSVLEEGGYSIKGRTEAQKNALLADARALEEAGVFSIVLELVTPKVAGDVSRAITVPTVGIGSGLECDGQILVSYDLIGLFPWFRPKFVKGARDLGIQIRDIGRDYVAKVNARVPMDCTPDGQL